MRCHQPFHLKWKQMEVKTTFSDIRICWTLVHFQKLEADIKSHQTLSCCLAANVQMMFFFVFRVIESLTHHHSFAAHAIQCVQKLIPGYLPKNPSGAGSPGSVPRLQQLCGWPNRDQAHCGGGRHGKEHGGTDGQSVWLGQDCPGGGDRPM